jgi:predicted phosphodiesterase
MRALVIGDIHTEAVLLRKTIEHGLKAGVDVILSVGDIVDGPGDPVACIALLRAHRAHVVLGNHERWVIEGYSMDPFDYPREVLAWLSELPATRALDSPTGQILLCHGIARADMLEIDTYTRGEALDRLEPLWEIVRSRQYRWMIGGHTHRAMVRTIAGSRSSIREHSCSSRPGLRDRGLRARRAGALAAAPDDPTSAAP